MPNIPTELVPLIEPESFVIVDNGFECALFSTDKAAIQQAVGHPFWADACGIRLVGRRTSTAPGTRLLDIALHESVRRLDLLTGLSWGEAAHVLKLPRRLPLKRVGFSWVHGEHILRRFGDTNAIAELRVLEIHAVSFDARVGNLLNLLVDRFQWFESMVLVTGTRLGSPSDLAFEIRRGDTGFITRIARSPALAEGITIEGICKGFGIPIPRRIENR